MPSKKSLPPGAARIMPIGARIRLVEAAIDARNTHFSHMSCRTASLAAPPKLQLPTTSAMARTRSDILPSRSPKPSDCTGPSWTTSRFSFSVTAVRQSPPSTWPAPTFFVENVQMTHTVEQRDDRCPLAYCRRERLDRIVEVVRLAVQQHRVKLFLDGVGLD